MRAANSAPRVCRKWNRVARGGVYAGLAAATLLVASAWAGQENAVSAAEAEASSGDRMASVAPNYDLEERFLPDRVSKLVVVLGVTRRWVSECGRFWDSYERAEGTGYYVVDRVRKTKTPLWD